MSSQEIHGCLLKRDSDDGSGIKKLRSLTYLKNLGEDLLNTYQLYEERKYALKLLHRAVSVACLCLASCDPLPAFGTVSEVWEATGYDACVKCCGKADGITASGVKAQANRTVAVNWLPFGTRLEIEGQLYRVEDRGARSHFGSRKNPKKRVDIYFRTHHQALRFGRRKVRVVVLK